MQSFEGSVEQQDSKGWTPIMWSSSNGYSQLVKQLIQRGADVNHMGQAKSGSGTTMALHECAAMRGEGAQSHDAYFESAWLLMSAGASPFAERSDGMTPIEVAAAQGNMKMKAFLETCSLFRGTLALPVPQTFGSKVKNRYCTVQPRFPFGNAAPTLWMVCYKSPNDPQASCRIPLSNARVMVEGPQDSCNGIIIIPGSGKQQKGVAIKSHTSNSFIIEVRAIGSASMPGWRTLRTLADVCKAAAVAVSCRNLDQLCTAALRQATRQMRVPGTSAETFEEAPLVQASQQEGGPPGGIGPIKDAKSENATPKKVPPMTDTAEDMTLQPAPSIQSAVSQGLDSAAEPGTPTSSRASDIPRRPSMGLGKLFKSTFSRRSSVANKPRYGSSLLDSNSSLGQFSNAETQDQGRKSGIWKGIKKSISGRPPASQMPSITEQSGGGLTAADIDALSQPIPDKFWSKIGRRMSNQRSGKMPMQPGRLQQNWFHNDEGTLPAEGGLPLPAAPRRSFNYNDLDELMYPGKAPQPSSGHGAGGGAPPVNLRRQTADNIQSRAAANGTVAFVLEEPIVPTQEMVPTGPRRSFSFDDLEEAAGGAGRKGRGHREEVAMPTAAAASLQVPQPSALRQMPQSRSMPSNRLVQDPRVLTQQASLPGYGQRQQPLRQASPRAQPSFQAPLQPSVGRPQPFSMPRRSFSLHNIDDLLKPMPTATPEAVQDDIQAWRRSHGLQPIGGGGKKRGPAIDPFSHGGYQGEHAPEWKPYRPPSAQQVVTGLQARQGADPRLAGTRSLGKPPQQAISRSGNKISRSTEEAIPPELAHLASLRALETETLSTTSRADEKAGGSSNQNTLSQDLNSELYASAQGPEAHGSASGKPQQRAAPEVVAAASPTKVPSPTSTEQLQRSTSNVRVSPAVPAVLFQGTKLPKFSSPPQRSSREASDVPEFPASPQD